MLNYKLLSRISKHITKIKVVVFFFTLLPFFILLNEFFQDGLGLDPLDRITRLTGKSALILLILSLVVTPLRHFLVIFMVRLKANYGKRRADWNWIIKLRRMVSLMSFFYACLHLVIYFWLDQGASFSSSFYDIKERNFIAVGLAAFILLVPLAITSSNWMMRKLGKKWRRLHRTVYLILILAITHFWMLSKLGVHDYVPYFLVGLFLLGWRFWYYVLSDKGKLVDDGMEAIDREQIARIIKNLSILSEKKFGVKEGKVMASTLFHILASESHYSESILNRKNNAEIEMNLGSKSMVRRLKVARHNANKRMSVKSIVGIQAIHRLDLLELVYKIDAILKQGIMAEKIGDNKAVDEVWNEIFSELMPISKV